MEIVVLKYGDLLGSPDVKELQLRAGPGTPAAHALWEQVFAIKTAFGLSGQATSLLLLEPARPEAFPAVVDLSFITPGGQRPDGEDPLEAALSSLRARGVAPSEVKSALCTHGHPDHFDPRLIPHLPGAAIFAPEGAGIPGARPFDEALFGGLVEAIDTPGHGGPHSSYLLDLPQLDLSVCLAGDLVMSQAHLLSLDHPLAFTDHGQGRASLARVRQALAARGLRFQVIFPGHDVPIFLSR